MPHPELSQPILVTRSDALADLASRLSEEPIVAVDTESNSLYAYKEQVCLVQFSTSEADYLVDPLAIDNLSSLAGFFENKDVEKVFHAGEYDLICLKRDYDFRFNNLFDTMIAARTLGRKQVGLGPILKSEFGVELNKRYQRANWGQRPLPPDLLAYARLDTHYLLPLRRILKDQLVQADRWDLATEDFSRLCDVSPRPARQASENLWRINGASDLAPQHIAVLQELCLFRDRIAQAKNWPVFKVMGDKVLYSIAEAAPRNRESLERVPGIQWAVQRYGDGLIRAVQRGLKADPPTPPRHPRPNHAYLYRMDVLRTWRKREARRAGVDSDVILPRELMASIARSNPRNQKELAKIMEDSPRRLERYGEAILMALDSGPVN